MLQRGHSDFAWFRERAESLHNNSFSHYTDMASTTIDEQQDLLNPEPSRPKERAEHNLPPMSHAEATDPGVNVQNGAPVGPWSGSEEKGAANGSPHPPLINGAKSRQRDQDKVIYEKHVNKAGEILPSIKPSKNFEGRLLHSGQTAPREKKSHTPAKRQDVTQDDLASGRRAGAGWEKSAYVYTCGNSLHVTLPTC